MAPSTKVMCASAPYLRRPKPGVADQRRLISSTRRSLTPLIAGCIMSFGVVAPLSAGIDQPRSTTAGVSAAATRGRSDWRLVPPINAQADAALTRTPDLLRSDPDLAGLMLRCGADGLTVIVVVVQPYAPGSHPRVSLDVGRDASPDANTHFDARINDYGNALQLPPGATGLLQQVRHEQSEMAIDIVSGDTRMRGVVPLAGMKAATESLPQRCRL